MPKASICRSPPESAPAVCVATLAQDRKRLEHFLDSLRRAIVDAERVAAHAQVLEHREIAEHARALRHEGNSGRDVLAAAPTLLTSLSSKRIVPSRCGPSPNTARSTVDLPAPFGPITAAMRRSASVMSMPNSTCFLP